MVVVVFVFCSLGLRFSLSALLATGEPTSADVAPVTSPSLLQHFISPLPLAPHSQQLFYDQLELLL